MKNDQTGENHPLTIATGITDKYFKGQYNHLVKAGVSPQVAADYVSIDASGRSIGFQGTENNGQIQWCHAILDLTMKGPDGKVILTPEMFKGVARRITLENLYTAEELDIDTCRDVVKNVVDEYGWTTDEKIMEDYNRLEINALYLLCTLADMGMLMDEEKMGDEVDANLFIAAMSVEDVFKKWSSQFISESESIL